MTTTYLYRHFDGKNRLLYVGISLRPFSRLDQHRLYSFWFDQIEHVRLEKYPSREAASIAERDAIQLERPIFNIVHSPPDEDYDDRCERAWNIIMRIEPQLRNMWFEAAEAPGCPNRVWYGEMKPRLCNLVGFGARDPLLKSREVYEIAYHTIYSALPGCGPQCEHE